MKRVKVYPAGYKVYNDNDELIGYECAPCGEGWVYKNENAFYGDHDEICYISEHSFDDKYRYVPEFKDLEGDFIPVEAAESEGETHKTIAEQVREEWGEEYFLTDEQVEYFAEDVFSIAEWACIQTYLVENFELDNCIEFDGIKDGGMFTKFQYDAVMNGMTPKEYAERELSYGELIEFCREFDEAFVVDEDCEDDWSDKGLGTNARLTYVDQRRDGLISGPDEFDCDEKWRKSIKR